MMSTTIIFVLTLYASKMVLPVFLKTCITQKDCNPQGSSTIICGICNDKLKPGKPECEFPFSSAYKEDRRCEAKKSCPKDCSSHGLCKSVDAIIPICECKDGYHDAVCGTSTPPEHVNKLPINGFGIKFPIWFNPGELRKYGSVFTCATQFHDPDNEKGYSKVTVSANRGWHTSSTLNLYETSKGRICQPGSLLQSTVVMGFAYEMYHKPDSSKQLTFLTLGDRVLGYMANITANLTIIKDNANALYGYNYWTWTYKVMVYYEKDLTCVPYIILHNCGTTREKSQMYSMKERVNIVSQIIYIADGRYISTTAVHKPECADAAKLRWDLRREAPNSYEEKVTTMIGTKDLTFDSYYLKPGYYRIYFKVSLSRSNAMTQNNVFGYFKVIPSPLEATIIGGSEKNVKKAFGIKLRSKAYPDPNSRPSNQSHVQAVWWCKDLKNPKNNPSFCEPVTLLASEIYQIPGSKLSYDSKYRFYLQVKTDIYDWCKNADLQCDDVSPQTASVDITILSKKDEGEDSIEIQCIKNCGKKVVPNQQLFLKAVSLSKNELKGIEWIVRKGNTELALDDLILPNLASFMLIVQESKLEMGTEYTIEVKSPSIADGTKYAFKTHTFEYEGNCTVFPELGVKGETLFTIECDPGQGGLTFDFYNKHADEANNDLMFGGRMLGSSSGRLQNIMLTRNKVFVYMVNRVGLFKSWSTDVTLEDKYVDDKVLDQIFFNLSRVVLQGNDMNTMQFVSSIVDIVPDTMDKSKVLDRLLSTITMMPVKFFPEIKMTTSTLNNILVGLNKPTKLALSPHMMMATLALMERNTAWFKHLVADWENALATSPKELLQIAEVQLDALNNALISRDPNTVDKDPDYFDFKTANELVKGSINAEKTIELIQDVLAYIQSPGQPPIQISSSNKDIAMWVVENDDDYPFTNYLGNLSVALTPDSFEHLKNELEPKETLALQVATMTENIFWWCKSAVKSNLVSVSVSREHPIQDIIKITDVSKPIDVHIKLDPDVQRPVVTDQMTQPDPAKLSPVELDLSVKIHRLDPEAESLTVIEFLYPPTTHNLRVFIEPEFRPDYGRILKKSVVISENSNKYPIPLIHKEDEYFLFMGVLPAADVPVNETVTYSFRTDSKLCQRWAQGQWSSSGCKISAEKTTSEHVVCSCDHFSIFSAAFPVPPQEIDPFRDAYLFLTVLDNPLVFSIMLCFLFVYILLCIWAWYRDRKDRGKRNVVILDDNFPGDRFPYLLAVYTSSRFNSGTTANVGLRIFGTISCSRVHILSSKDRKILRKNSDDWFLIYCSQPLGDLESLHIWHDNVGSDPDWHLDKIIVYSLEEDTETVFVFEQWLSLRVNEYPEALVVPYTKSDVTSIKRMFLDNCVFGLRESHILLSIILRHPRSEVTRLQRISTVMVGITVAMLCSIMFYAPPDDDQSGVDEPKYDVSKRDFYISIQTMVLSVIATIFIFCAFRRSYKILKTERTSRTYEEEDEYEGRRTDKTLYGNFVKFVTKTLKSQPLNPVQLPYTKPTIVVRKVWLTIAWVLCISIIIISSYFVILYGLKLGAATSQKWLTSLLLTMGEDVFIQGPGKIILISIILSLAMQKVCEVNTHQVLLKDVRDLEAPNDDQYLKRLLAKRSHPMYAPLRTDVKAVIIEKRLFYHNCWLTTDFTISLLFVINVCVAISYLWSSHYYANHQVATQMTTSSYPDNTSVSFFRVRTIQDLDIFFKTTLMSNLYTTRWYDQSFIEDFARTKQYWNDDYAHKMLGLPMLRQLRVHPKSCKNMVLDGKDKCIPVWSYSVEDNDMYGPGWKMAFVRDLNRKNSPWLYKDQTTTKLNTFYRLTGASGTLYGNGGFSVTLGPSRQETDQIITDLLDQHWQNLLTKVVFLELTLYNVNRDLFSQVTLMVEYPVSGSIQLKAQVTSVEGKLQLRAWNVFFILFFMFYLVRAARVINRAGLLDYMKTYRNVTRLIVLILCLLCFLTASFHYYLSMKFHSEFQNQMHNSYFDFDSFIYHFANLKLVLSVLFCVAVVRMMILFRGGRRFMNHLYTIQLSWNWVVWLTVMTFILVMFLVHIVLIFNIFGGNTVLQLVINQQISHYLTFKEISSPKVQIFFFIKIVFLQVVKSFYLIIFMYNSKLAKTHNVKQSDHFSFITFLLSLLKVVTFRKSKKK